jgi:hypothetical protein
MKIFITGLPLEVGEDELTAVFGDFGQVKSLRIIKDRETGQSRGFGFVEMPVDEEAKEARETRYWRRRQCWWRFQTYQQQQQRKKLLVFFFIFRLIFYHHIENQAFLR